MGKKIPAKFIDEPGKVQMVIDMMLKIDEFLEIEGGNVEDSKAKLSVAAIDKNITAPPEVEKKVKFAEQPQVMIIEDDDEYNVCIAEDDDATDAEEEEETGGPKLEAFSKFVSEIL